VSVYVDDLQTRRPSGRMARRYGDQWCHLWADSEQELREFARGLGLRQSWFQPHHLLCHFDLTPNKREEALAAGALRMTVTEYMRRKTGS
jgi:hypothetical protein